MIRWLKRTFDGPQIWLTIGAVLIALSFVVGYHQDQRLADAALAEKIDLPSPVAIQDFSQGKHTNMLEEFQLLAEVDLDRGGIRTIGVGSMQAAYLLVPAYPLSAAGRQIANLRLRGETDADAPSDPSGARPSGSQQSFPVAILVYDISANPSAPRTFDSIGLQFLGAGPDGDVVLLAGTMFDRAMWQDALTGTAFDAALVEISGEGADFLTLIAPRLKGNVTGGKASELSRLVYVYLAFGLAFILFGGVMYLKSKVPEPRRIAQKIRPLATRIPSIPPFSFFQPIVSQEDLIDADEDVPPSAHIPKFMNRAADAIVRNRVKSRL